MSLIDDNKIIINKHLKDYKNCLEKCVKDCDNNLLNYEKSILLNIELKELSEQDIKNLCYKYFLCLKKKKDFNNKIIDINKIMVH